MDGVSVPETHLADSKQPDRHRLAASLDAAGDLDEAVHPHFVDRLGTEPDLAGNAHEEPSKAISEELDVSQWRNEISARLHRYRTRRKLRPPRYPSLSLPFEPEGPSHPPAPSLSAIQDFKTISSHALALDGMREVPPAPDPEASAAARPDAGSVSCSWVTPSAGHPGAKILEFPRFAWAPPPPPPDQLAEPVADKPRILEVPEVPPALPALGGISIEAPESKEVDRLPGTDLPFQSASLARRLLAVGIDGMIIALAAALFGTIFWKVAAVRPPLAQIAGLAVGVLCLLWSVYQYLLVVHGAETPGLRAAGLELICFDGNGTQRSLRRWRVLASYLSAASLGMGYIWVFLDEDRLCWHDRITHTYLAPRKRTVSGA